MKSFRLKLSANKYEILFFAAYGIFLFFSVLSTSLFYQYFSGTLYSLIMLMCVGMIAVSELFICGGYNKKQQIAIVFSVIAYAVVLRVTGSYVATVAIMPFFLFAARKVEFRRIACFSAIMMLFILVFVVLSSKVGIVRSVSVVLYNGRRRAFLGFRFPLNPATITFNVCALWVYYRKQKIRLLELFFLLGLDGFIYLKTDSKLCFAATLCVIFFGFVLKYMNDTICDMKKLTFILVFSFAIALLISLAFALAYDNKIRFMRKLDDVLEGRLYYANLSLKKYAVTLFGEDIPWVGYGRDESGNLYSFSTANYFYVDNMYIQIMQHYGLIFFSIYMALNTGTMYRCWKNEDMYALMILTVIAFKCIIDNLSFYLYYNTFWFMISYVYLYKKRTIADEPAVKRLLRMIRYA